MRSLIWQKGAVHALLLNVTTDCRDAARVAAFWSGLIGWPASFEDMPGNPYWVVGDPAGSLPRLVFVTAGEVTGEKNPVHLDLLPVDGAQEKLLDRALALGAKVIDDRRELEPGGWIVLADPEGNEFCLEAG